jgi:hypothetical protein
VRSGGILSATLDSIGRWILTQIDWSTLGLLTVLIVLVFLFWRHHYFGEWPSRDDCIGVALGLLGIFNAIIVGIVFVMTNPPAIESLSRSTLVIVGLVTSIITIGYALPRLWAQFFPPRPLGRPPEKDR